MPEKPFSPPDTKISRPRTRALVRNRKQYKSIESTQQSRVANSCRLLKIMETKTNAKVVTLVQQISHPLKNHEQWEEGSEGGQSNPFSTS